MEIIMGRSIKVMQMGDVGPGNFIADVDDDYPLDSTVPADHYDVEEQDWQRIARRHGYADLSTYTLEGHDGTPWTTQYQSSATVWVLCENGHPVVQDEPNS